MEYVNDAFEYDEVDWQLELQHAWLRYLGIAAEAWISHGFPVFTRPLYYKNGSLIKGGWAPCSSCVDHTPHNCGCLGLLCHGHHRATLDFQIFDRQLQRALNKAQPQTTVGLAVVVPDGHVVLDVDRHEGKPDGLAAFSKLVALEDDGQGPIVTTDPPTLKVNTVSGGLHIYFSGLPMNCPVPRELSPGLEVKGPGSSLLVPPSYEPLGNAYSVGEDFSRLITAIGSIQPAPVRLLEIFRETIKSDSGKRYEVSHRVQRPLAGIQRRPIRMSVQDILEHVVGQLEERGKRVDRRGAGYLAQCPAHDDRNPSCHIKAVEDRVLLHCFAGCSFGEIVSALGLQPFELFAREPS